MLLAKVSYKKLLHDQNRCLHFQNQKIHLFYFIFLHIFLLLLFAVQKYSHACSPISVLDTVDLAGCWKGLLFLSVRIRGFRNLLIFVVTLTSKSVPSQLCALGRKEHLFHFECITSQFYQAAQAPLLWKNCGPDFPFVYMALFHMPLSVPSSHLNCHWSNTSLLCENTHLHYDNLLSFSAVVMFS